MSLEFSVSVLLTVQQRKEKLRVGEERRMDGQKTGREKTVTKLH
jgi:hypothetical protein